MLLKPVLWLLVSLWQSFTNIPTNYLLVRIFVSSPVNKHPTTPSWLTQVVFSLVFTIFRNKTMFNRF